MLFLLPLLLADPQPLSYQFLLHVHRSSVDCSFASLILPWQTVFLGALPLFCCMPSLTLFYCHCQISLSNTVADAHAWLSSLSLLLLPSSMVTVKRRCQMALPTAAATVKHHLCLTIALRCFFSPGSPSEYCFSFVLQILKHMYHFIFTIFVLCRVKTLYLTLTLLSLYRNSVIWG